MKKLTFLLCTVTLCTAIAPSGLAFAKSTDTVAAPKNSETTAASAETTTAPK